MQDDEHHDDEHDDDEHDGREPCDDEHTIRATLFLFELDELLPLDVWAENQLAVARASFEAEGHAPPVFLFLGPHPLHPLDQTRRVQGCLDLVPFFTGVEDAELELVKDSMAVAILDLIAMYKAIATMLICEAWVREVSLGLGASAVGDRYEIFTTVFETKTSYRARRWKINRDAGKPSIGEELPEAIKSSGRFSTFLHARPVGLPN